MLFGNIFREPTAIHHSLGPIPLPNSQPFALFATESSALDNVIATRINGGQEQVGVRVDGDTPLGYLILLVFEAVLEVVCVSLPGYIIAKQGMFSPDMQKFVANLNVSLFTPCLIFTKLASQLTLSKIVELAVIPVIFAFMTLTSYLCSLLMCRMFRLGKRASNFVIAMGVFGNSNSLPISLVISLSMTIRGLHWDRIPGDNDEDVAARGILYLLIFQQLGQLVRWSWGYHILLAPRGSYDELDDGTPAPVDVHGERYRDELGDGDSDSDLEGTGRGMDPFEVPQFQNSFVGLQQPDATLIDGIETIANGDTDEINNFLTIANTRYHSRHSTAVNGYSETNTEYPTRAQSPTTDFNSSSSTSLTGTGDDLTSPPKPPVLRLPDAPVESKPESLLGKAWEKVKNAVSKMYTTFLSVMNPPLWAMLVAVMVASIPKLQFLFFTPGTFIQGSVTRAISQSGNVAVPLILVVLGANLANNTGPSGSTSPRAKRHHNKLLIASILSRMVLPFFVTAPLLAIAAKWLPISILDDPIFVVVCFLLVGAPSALQLAQICQINEVYESVMARILFWSYVVVILPSTVVLVVTAVEVVKWAA